MMTNIKPNGPLPSGPATYLGDELAASSNFLVPFIKNGDWNRRILERFNPTKLMRGGSSAKENRFCG